MRFSPPALLCISLSLALSHLSTAQADEDDRSQRSFRPIVPIKQNVNPGRDRVHTQTVTVKIPPPPIPAPSSALFPEGSVPEIDLPPEPLRSEEASAERTEEETAAQESTESVESDPIDPDAPTLSQLREEAHELASRGLTYKFGAHNPKSGGLDCSGAMQYLLTKVGVEDVPRTSYDQYYWLKREKLLDDVYGKSASKKLFKKLSPGDLIFWGGTWKSGHKVSHVMLYMGYDANEDKHWVFGARSKNSKGLLGNGVDLFELDPDRGRLIAHGKIPGLQY
ncbi:MAG: NlpC/P60 family protein [Verrucomicrobiota bacterium]